MKRVKKPKSSKDVKLSAKERNDITMAVTKKLFPRFTGLFLIAVIDVMKPTNEQLTKIIDTTNPYAGYINDGIVSIDELKKDIEHKTGRKLEGLLK